MLFLSYSAIHEIKTLHREKKKGEWGVGAAIDKILIPSQHSKRIDYDAQNLQRCKCFRSENIMETLEDISDTFNSLILILSTELKSDYSCN